MGALLEPLSTHGAWIPSISTMDAQDVGFDITIPSEKLETYATCVFVTHFSKLTNIGVLVMLLILMSL